MALTTIQKKTPKTKKKGGLPSKKSSLSKSDSPESPTEKELLRAFWKGETISSGSAPGGVRPDKSANNTSWSKPRALTPKEKEQFQKAAFDDLGRIKLREVGRPKKPIDEKLNVNTIRLSLKQVRNFSIQAKKEGYPSWQIWIKKIAEERLEK
jgi:hypothetical protein